MPTYLEEDLAILRKKSLDQVDKSNLNFAISEDI